MTNQEIMAVVKPAICNQLKSPASAQFPVDLISIVGDDTRGYQVSGFVDSQNSYGAMIRNDFAATVAVENGFPVVKSATVAQKQTHREQRSLASTILLSVLLPLLAVPFCISSFLQWWDSNIIRR